MPPNTSSPVPTNACPPNGVDSPLSTTANILSILTFALGLFASYIALISATRGAPAEIKRLVDDLRTTQKEINRVAGYIFDDMHYPTSVPYHGTTTDHQAEGDLASITHEANTMNGSAQPVKTTGQTPVPRNIPSLGPQYPNAFPTNATNDALYTEVQGLLKTCVTLFYEADDLLKRSERDPYGFRRRILFVMNRNEVTEKMNRLADQKAKLAAIQMSLFIR
ncbi:MAG: hypothetical protein Q9169_003521 [Polycauliona sp. 2 TL-2023]